VCVWCVCVVCVCGVCVCVWCAGVCVCVVLCVCVCVCVWGVCVTCSRGTLNYQIHLCRPKLFSISKPIPWISNKFSICAHVKRRSSQHFVVSLKYMSFIQHCRPAE